MRCMSWMAEIGKLMEGIKESKLPVDLIVLADHGMVELKGAPVSLDRFGFNPAWFDPIVGLGLYPKSEEDAAESFRGDAREERQVYRVPAGSRFRLICILTAIRGREIR